MPTWQIAGTRSAVLKVNTSATWPVNGGMTAPPTIATAMIPEAEAERGPRPSDASEKMVGNMIELQRPIARSDQPDTAPVVCEEMNSSVMTPADATASTLPGENKRSRYEPMKRPTMAPPQYSGTCSPAAFCPNPRTSVCIR